MSRKAICVVMIVMDVLAFAPSLLGIPAAGFAWDDATDNDPASKFLPRIALTAVLLSLPFLIASNVRTAAKFLWRAEQSDLRLWLTFTPTMLLFGAVTYLGAESLLQMMRDRRDAKFYDAIIAQPDMKKFGALTHDLYIWNRLDLARRVQREFQKDGSRPPETAEELYANQARQMVRTERLFHCGRMSEADHYDQTRSDWAQFEGIYDKFGTVGHYDQKFFITISNGLNPDIVKPC